MNTNIYFINSVFIIKLSQHVYHLASYDTYQTCLQISEIQCNNLDCLECGVANRMERIVGGWVTNVNEYPWVVALTAKGRFYCGGTIINDLYILTAAHCVRSVGGPSLPYRKSRNVYLLIPFQLFRTNKTQIKHFVEMYYHFYTQFPYQYIG